MATRVEQESKTKAPLQLTLKRLTEGGPTHDDKPTVRKCGRVMAQRNLIIPAHEHQDVT